MMTNGGSEDGNVFGGVMKDWLVIVGICVGAVVGVVLYEHLNGFGTQCKKMFPESEVKRMICVEKRENGTTIEQIWEEL